ncbi:hypothetical protein [Psychrobacter sp. I-STPA10]|uniref:hypothetical protein n=1 Tax=Psychrobacter sp. I-STPA10 TaxID=2585769 RepID=UPI001E5A69BF|nr:hypothetical protein [Psychrobacter sp. I-STPA10]
MANHDSLPKDVWAAARLIWETTPKISYSELIEQLKDVFGDEAPKSKSTISNRIKKEGWVKKRTLKKGSNSKKEGEKERTEGERSSNTVERMGKTVQSAEHKNNKDEEGQALEVYRTAEQKAERVAENLVMSVEQRAERIVTHRKRLRRLGVLQDTLTELATEILEVDFNFIPSCDKEGGDGDVIAKKLVMADTLSQTLSKLTASQKMIAEMEFPICGISAEDFSQSEQDRRLEALEALAGIDEEERAARARLHGSLMNRLESIERMEHDPDFFTNTDDIDDVDFDEE